MLTLRNDLARALAQVIAGNDLDAVTVETLRAGVRLSGALLDLVDAGREELPKVVLSLGPDPDPARLDRHARIALATGYREVRTAAAMSPTDNPGAMGAAAEALADFGQWCRHSGLFELAALLAEAALAGWPMGVRAEQRLRVAFRRALTDAWGAPGLRQASSGRQLADSFDAQVRAAQLPAMLPLADFLRGVHEVNCGRFVEAERIARSIIRRARHSGDRWTEGYGLELATTAVGRQRRYPESIAISLRYVHLDGAMLHGRVGALLNVGVGFQMMGLFDPALEAYAAALDWERRIDTHPLTNFQNAVAERVLEIFALRGSREQFVALYRQLDAASLMPHERILFHRDAATGFMRFGEVDAAVAELSKAQAIAERHGYHFDWFAIEAEIRTLRNVHSQGRDVATLEESHAALVRDARAAWRTLEMDDRVLTAST